MRRIIVGKHGIEPLTFRLKRTLVQAITTITYQFVGRGGFAPPKAQKSHIKHELDADLSTSGTRTSSPLVSTKYFFLKSKVFSAENLVYGVLVFFNALTS